MNGYGHLQERLMAREKLFSLASTIPYLSGNGHIVQYLSICSENGRRTKGTKALQYFLD